ncbi:hypothetical protein BOX15_Mlig012501g5 [Macrostomum lignano]|uniref:Transposase domain-containing protein n=1 Tax=Macrostomum lignano TaxID=282301 RepID=A0A267G4X1_9PLAT|nr:hypothetical protein BOX15_Mlig012501g5 [Macrostomum lignano]
MASWKVRRLTSKRLLALFKDDDCDDCDVDCKTLEDASIEPSVQEVKGDNEEDFGGVEFDDLQSISESDKDMENDKDEDNWPLEEKLEALLVLFFTTYNISRDAMAFLLAGLCDIGLPISKSVTKIKRLAREDCPTGDLLAMGDGHFRYVSILENLQLLLSKNLLTLRPENLQHQGPTKVYKFDAFLNSDGIPLYRSSLFGLWPLLMKIPSAFAKPFPVAVWAGSGKPPLQEYLQQFCKEAKRFLSGPVKINEKVSIMFSTIYFVVDTPARSFLMCTMGHTSYSGCSYCQAVGSRAEGRVTFSVTVNQSRCRKDYRSLLEDNLKRDATGAILKLPLLCLPNIDFVNCFPLDFQHAVCLGAVRKLMHYYFGEGGCRFGRRHMKPLSDYIAAIASWTPSNFQRRPRRIDKCLIGDGV